MFKKIDIYYKDSKGKVHYLHSTKSFKYVYLAVQYAKDIKILYPQTWERMCNIINEQIIKDNIFGRIDKK